MSHPLYIGLNGYAGSGKDTVAKALRLMLSYDWESFEDFIVKWEQEAFKMHYATYGGSPEDEKCYCVAFADQLKYICSAMFNIPLEKFYYNKENSWLCITGDYSYTEHRPNEEDIITAEEYDIEMNSYRPPYCDTEQKHKWMSLREVLVYVGTYVCQRMINQNCFLNSASNMVKRMQGRNSNLEYVICTDVRFAHEFDFIKAHGGININIIRDGVQYVDNIAEHELDDEEMFDFTIHNDGTYNELLTNLWELVHSEQIFKNTIVELSPTVAMRKVDSITYMVCAGKVKHKSVDYGDVIAVVFEDNTVVTVGDMLNGAGTVKSIEYDETYGWTFLVQED